jgi:DNA-binding FadR family transcriptional regulator
MRPTVAVNYVAIGKDISWPSGWTNCDTVAPMTLRAVESRSLSDQVFEQLTAEIVGGALAAGSTIPSERTLSEVFAVNRHVVREALKRLEQVGLVRIVQGDGTRVLDFRRTAGLDLLAVLADHAVAFDGVLPLLRSALEMRAGVGVDVVRLCTERADAAVREELVALAGELHLVRQGPELLAVDWRFWQRVLDGADNLAYQLAFNSLMRGVHAVPELSVPSLEHELAATDYRRPIAAAIAAGDADAATTATRSALGLARDAVSALASSAAETESERGPRSGTPGAR